MAELFMLGDPPSGVLVSENQLAAYIALTRGRYACIAGGARSGKTFLILRGIVTRALKGNGSRHAILRQHANAARISIALDTLPKIMKLCFPEIRIVEHSRDGFFQLPNGSRLFIGGLDDKDHVEKILGQEYTTVYLNEASQINYQSALVAFTRLAQVVPGLTQRAYVDLNPLGKSHWTNLLFGEKRDPISRRPLPDPENYVQAFLNPRDNAHNLTPETLQAFANLPDKQRKRFYEGIYADEVEGALWTYERIEKTRCELAEIPEGKRASVVVAVDPSGASNKDDDRADEIGIVVAARGQDGHGYILADRSLRDGPLVWGRLAVHAFHEFNADCIVAESNFGGEMVRAVITAADPNVPVRLVTASRGKAVRAEPVSVRYEKGEIHHAGRFPKLEDQLCAFSSAGYKGAGSPDHADACLVAGTMVTTHRGEVPIEQVRVTDKVLTRAGMRRVCWAGTTGTRETYVVRLSNGRELRGTHEHPVFVQQQNFVNVQEFLPLGDLRAGDVLLPKENLEWQVSREMRWPRQFALAAGLRSWLGSRLGLRKSAPLRVQGICTGPVEPVFNLHVEDCHEFFANGVLVHNCIWACTYLLGIGDGTGIIEFYRREVEAHAANGSSAQSLQNGLSKVALQVPIGTGTVIGMSGQSYIAGLDGIIQVEPIDAPALRGAGFADVVAPNQ
jgi:phage terminase large subunit-like protein